MRPHHIFYWIIGLFLLAGCQGEPGLPGPVGPPGSQGPPGDPGPLSLMYEIEFDLVEENDWRVRYVFPEQDEIFVEDVVLVYLLWEQETLDNGDLLDIWRLMPVTLFTESGLLQFTSDFTVGDVDIFFESDFMLDSNVSYLNEVARIVVVPADISPNARTEINYEDYYEVAKLYGLSTDPVQLKRPIPKR